ncbi:Cd209 antigen [Plakobranchus ocellatus]|uniref:Cd209 antigen n=1 Tax=Plakobranchus ocellatus TaxID=259542 RepID=A0AAV3Z1S6_9GAST|nr:Cd209 antigen [Plakobranchus ocellatus]
MSVLPILLLLGILVAATFQAESMPTFVVSEMFQNSVYFLSKQAAKFDLRLMNRICKDIGGYLVEIDSPKEQDFLSKFVTGMTRHYVYTGANDVMREGTFVYYNSKKPMPALKWYENNPDNWLGDENCVHITSEGLNDICCDHIAKYLCELKVAS